MSAPTRGERNNNPGNIDFHAATTWQGQLGVEDGAAHPRFIRFDCPENGVRAIAKVLLSYQRVHGLKTIRQLLERWAPPGENDTGAYVADVATRLRCDPDADIDASDEVTLAALCSAIIRHENGRQPYDTATIDEGVQRALA